MCNSLRSKETEKNSNSFAWCRKNSLRHVDLASIVQKADSAIHWIKLYSVDNVNKNKVIGNLPRGD